MPHRFFFVLHTICLNIGKITIQVCWSVQVYIYGEQLVQVKFLEILVQAIAFK
jgi:hypothetical protein